MRSFPVEERDDLVWIWMGDPAKANPDEIVRWPWHSRWPYRAKSEVLKCNYLLASDNLLDQTHGAYVHKSTLASAPDDYARAEMQTDPTPNGVKFTRWMLNCIPPGLYASAVKFEGRVDRWQEFEYVAHPASYNLLAHSMWARALMIEVFETAVSECGFSTGLHRKLKTLSGFFGRLQTVIGRTSLTQRTSSFIPSKRLLRKTK